LSFAGGTRRKRHCHAASLTIHWKETIIDKVGDIVRISSPKLGSLVNRVDWCDRIAPWSFGVRALFSNLAAHGLLNPARL
jgi:hypothetical protein